VLLGAAAVVAVPSVALAAVAGAQPATWDIEAYENCLNNELPKNSSPAFQVATLKMCCLESGGVWRESDVPGVTGGRCVAPPGDSQGSRQLPGNVQIPSDIAAAPLTKEPPRPIRVTSDIAPVSTVSQGDGSVS
jgi:hypothetical protein